MTTAWAKELYEQFAPVRRSLKGHTEAEINQAIGETVKETPRTGNIVFSGLTFARFDPQTDDASALPGQTGLYIVCLKRGAALPDAEDAHITKFDGQGVGVIYVGIANTTLHKRILDQFRGNNAGRSTLRKSLGVLLGYRLVPRDRTPGSTRTKFTDEDEAELSRWMQESLVVYFGEHTRPSTLEAEIINKLDPLLNLKKIPPRSPNAAFRSRLSQLRRWRPT